MQSLADYLTPADWMQPIPAVKPKPPPCPNILAQIQSLIDDARTDKARAMYEQRLTIYMEATSHG